MRTALISDIHGNYAGLEAVLADITLRRCDRIVCLGDLVDGGAQGVEVVRAIRDHEIATVRGNHDESAVWNDDLPIDVRDYLRNLPEDIVEGGVLYAHSSPRIKREKIKDAIEAWNAFEDSALRRIFVGDLHVPKIWGQRCDEEVSAASYAIVYDTEFAFDPDDRYIICVGAVGYSRDAERRLRYAIYDSERDSVEFQAPDGPILVF